MLKNYFKVAWRNLWLNKTLAVIKILGLSIGLSVCILIFLFTKDELSYDQFHENKDRIFRVIQTWKINAEAEQFIGTTNSVVAETFAKEIPEVKQVTRINGTNVTVKKDNEVFSEFPLFVDDNFLSVFTFVIKDGNKSTALKDPYSVVLTEDMAKKYFGITDVIGKTIAIKINEEFENYIVTAIAENTPQNSTLSIGMLLNFNQYERFNSNQDWIGGSLNTMTLLSPQADPKSVEQKMQAVFDRNTREDLDAIKSKKGDKINIKLSLQPYTSIHLSTGAGPDNGMTNGSKPAYSYILSFIAIFILLIACINFINLAIGQSLKRKKEIGVRKVVGGSRKQLILQFLTESFLVSAIAFLLAVCFAGLILPFFNDLADKKLSLTYLADGYFYAGMFLLLLITSFIAGFYPSLILSSFRPVKALYSRDKMGNRKYFTHGLMVFQFSLAICLIFGTIAFHYQLKFLSEADLGYDSRNLVRLTIPVRKSSDPLPQLFKAELASNPGVIGVAARNGGRSIAGVIIGDKTIEIEKTKVDDKYIPTCGISLITGRNFSPQFPGDSLNSIIVNERFLKEAGLTTSEAIGKQCRMRSDDRAVAIIGVVKDYHFVSLKEKIMPLVLTMDPAFNFGEIWVKLHPQHMPATLLTLQSVFRKLVPDYPYSFRFMDDINAERYRTEAKWKQIITISSVFFIFISCMGLLGLVMMSVEQRVKEIGIRKVLGAATARIVLMISKDFLLLILVSFIIAVPVGYYFLSQWLQNFAYRMEIHWWLFGIAGLSALLIAALTISVQSVKAALANPVTSLRSE